MNWKYGVGVIVLLIGLGVMMASSGTAEEAEFDEATVHLSPDCGCCIQHADYLERAGVDVEVKEHSNAELGMLNEEMDIPRDYQACHITEVDDQTIVGHVPVDVFNEIMEEEPESDAVTLPGMPQGSPGMPGAKTGEWIFYEIEDGEDVGEFTRR